MLLNKYKRLVPKDFRKDEYLALNPDVRDANVDPYKHYIEHGFSEGRIYSLKNHIPPEFDKTIYLNLNPDVKIAGIDPEIHYAKFGRFQDRPYKIDSNIEFDHKWYISEYPEVLETGLSPYEHYRKVGIFEGRHPRFDRDWYLSEYSDIAFAGVDPLEHYNNAGRLECRHPAFHSFWYKIEYPDVKNSDLDALLHYKLIGKDEGRYPAFNKQWYLDEYPEVAAAGLDPYQHYMNNGQGEGRIPAFSETWYAREYPDVGSSGLGSYKHYRKYAKQVGYISGLNRQLITKNSIRLTDFPEQYDSQYQAQETFCNRSTEIKAIAFYLPQYHESEHNNKWWGNGFTEWTNTKKARPRFRGHYQPREPHLDIGYYDLSDPNVLRLQSELAKMHGIYGFCFYHYWFSGQRLLEKPVDLLLQNPDIDINFCLCWANENWTKTWDGQESNVLIAQEYGVQDPIKFIQDISVYLVDKRYIRIDGNPVIMVYKPHAIPNVGKVFSAWRYYWKQKTGEDLLIWCNRTESSDYSFQNIDAEIDAIVEFPPHVVPHTRHVPKYKLEPNFCGITNSGSFYDYRKLVDDIISGRDYSELPKVPFYRGVTLGWDNSARRVEGQSIWYGFSLDYYYKWLNHTIQYTRASFDKDNRFVFINAWNEWAEGTYLEPDSATGYSNLNTTSRALFGLPFEDMPSTLATVKSCNYHKSSVAIHLHCYFVEQTGEFIENFKLIKTNFHLFITTDSEKKKEEIEHILVNSELNNEYEILVTPNVGRDIGPMLISLSKKILEYDIIGHFHTKKSSTVDWGDRWRKFLTDNLIGSTDNIESIFSEFESKKALGLIYPPPYPLIAPHLSWGEVKDRCYELMDKMGFKVLLPSEPKFPVGNMFWAKVSAIEPLLQLDWNVDDFEIEAGQIEKTLPHCVERLWGYVASASGYSSKEVLVGKLQRKTSNTNNVRRLVLFVHFDQNNISISESDLILIKSLKEVSSYLCVVSNSVISNDAAAKACMYADDIFIRPNAGFDFGAWRDCLNRIGWNNVVKFDEIIFANNSCYGPVFPLYEVFDQMADAPLDLWGITSFPKIKNSGRPEAVLREARDIPAHIQSYFMVARKNVIESADFYRFWSTVKDKEDFMSVVTAYEMEFTDTMAKAGFKWGCILPEAKEMQAAMLHDHRFNVPYNQPYDLILLRSPFIKKRSWDYNFDGVVKSRNLIISSSDYPPHLIWR